MSDDDRKIKKDVGSSGRLDSPRRYQLSRKKGWKMPVNTVRVVRPGRWGNPWKVGKDGTREQCVEEHRKWIEGNIWSWPTKKDIQRELCGKNVACWCPLDDPCHGDTLLRLANAPADPPEMAELKKGKTS